MEQTSYVLMDERKIGGLSLASSLISDHEYLGRGSIDHTEAMFIREYQSLIHCGQ